MSEALDADLRAASSVSFLRVAGPFGQRWAKAAATAPACWSRR
jgi:hypothetical protein